MPENENEGINAVYLVKQAIEVRLLMLERDFILLSSSFSSLSLSQCLSLIDIGSQRKIYSLSHASCSTLSPAIVSSMQKKQAYN